MREIKFRAWNNRELHMISWDTMSDYDSEMFNFMRVLDGWDTHLVAMQYTGIEDKNGVEIYEGDIVKGIFSYSPPSQEIKDNPKMWSIKEVRYIDGGFYPLVLDGEENHFYEIEVIGNVCETPARVFEIYDEVQYVDIEHLKNMGIYISKQTDKDTDARS